MFRLISMLVSVAFLASCQPNPNESLWRLSSYSVACQNNANFKAYMLTLNLCRQESFNESGFQNCVDRAVNDRILLSNQCQEETRQVVVQASAFFLEKLISEDIDTLDSSDQEKAERAATYISYWLSKLPEDSAITLVESLFNRHYARTLGIINQDILNSNALLNGEGTNLTKSLDKFIVSTAVDYRQGFQDLLVTASFYDLLRSLKPKLKFSLGLKQVLCTLEECDWEQFEEVQFLAMISQISQGRSASAPSIIDQGPYSKAMIRIISKQEQILSALNKHSTRYDDQIRSDIDLKSSHPQTSRIYDLADVLNSLANLYDETSRLASGTSRSHETISFGVSRESLYNMASYLSSKGRSVRENGDNYSQNLNRWIQLLKQNLASESELNVTLREQNLLVRDTERLRNEINALRNAFIIGEEQFAGLQAKFNKLNLEPGVLGTLWSSEPIEEGLSVSPSMATYTTDMSEFDFSQLAFRSVDLQAGQSLHIQVQGEWGPACALSKDRPDIAIANLLTGPNGYIEVETQGRTTTSSREKSLRSTNYMDSSSRFDICQTMNLAGQIGSFSFNQCNSNTLGNRHDRSSSSIFSEADTRSSQVNFQGGLTLPSTPFKTLPAGSIVAVIRSADQPINYQVLNRATRINVATYSTVDLIINDCNEQPAAPSSQLSVDIHRLKSSSEDVKAALIGGLKAVDHIYATAHDVLKLGSDIEAEINLIAQEARADLYSQFSAFSRFDVAKQYMEQIIAHKSNQLIRQAKMLQKFDLYQSGMIRLSSYLREEMLGLARKDLLQLEAKGVIDDLSLLGIGPEIYDVAAFLTDHVFPVLLFHADQADISRHAGAALNSFRRAVHIDNSLGNKAKALGKLMEDLSVAISETKNMFRYTNQYSDLLITAPNPELPLAKTLNRGTPKLTGQQSLSLWQAFFGTKQASLEEIIFELHPDDVYGYSYAEGGASCISRNLVIEDVAFALVTNNTDLSRDDLRTLSRNKNIPIRIGPSFSFVTAKGPVHFQVAEPSEGTSIASFGMVRYDAYEDAYDFLMKDSQLGSAGKGLSPFSSWSFRTDPLKAFATLNSELFYQNSNRGALLGRGQNDAEWRAARDYFEDDFAAFNPTLIPEVNEGMEIELFPKRITDILILVRYSSLTRTDENELNWISSCR